MSQNQTQLTHNNLTVIAVNFSGKMVLPHNTKKKKTMLSLQLSDNRAYDIRTNPNLTNPLIHACFCYLQWLYDLLQNLWHTIIMTCSYCVVRLFCQFWEIMTSVSGQQRKMLRIVSSWAYLYISRTVQKYWNADCLFLKTNGMKINNIIQ